MKTALELRLMTPDEFDRWREPSVTTYAEDLLRYGQVATSAEGLSQAETEYQELLPQGLYTPRHQLYRLMVGETAVGDLWLNRDDARWFICGFDIAPEYRGKGYGRRALEALEQLIRSAGEPRIIVLHVFRDNPIARHLYETMGYAYLSLENVPDTSRYMKKTVQ